VLSLPGDALVRAYSTSLPRGVLVELERAWPTFVRPKALATRRAPLDQVSGKSLLRLFHAQPGAEVAIPFEVAIPGEYLVRVDGAVGPDHGDYKLSLDDTFLADWHGYAPEPEARRGDSNRRVLGPGRHTLTIRCVGRDPRSSGHDAFLDDLAGEAL
jgi:hypothetical protein